MAGNKRGRGGGKKASQPPAKRRNIELPDENEGREASPELSDEDLEFVQSNSKSLGWLEKMDKKALDRSLKERQAKEAEQVKPKKAEESDDEDNDEEEEEEADYERAPRLVGKSETDKSDRSRGLPVKTLDGHVIFQPKQQQRAQLRVQQLEEEEEGDDEQEHLEGKGGSMKKTPSTKNASAPSNVVTLMVPGVTIQDDLVDEGKREEDRRREEEEAQVVRQKEKQRAQQERAREAREEADGGLPAPLAATLRSIKDQQKRTQAAKEAIAVSAQKLLSGPEDHVAELKTLLALASPSRQEGRDPQVPRLALLSLLAVFRDIVPGYRIRLPTEEELKVKVSKDVQKVRDFEAALLRSYQSYLKLLLAAMGTGARSGAGAGAGAQRPPVQDARIALKCMSQLLATLPHFNYTSDLLQAVVPRMAARDPEMRTVACVAIKDLLRSDVDGGVALEAVQLIADLVKTRKCDCHPEVVRTLAVLTFSEVRREEPGEEVKTRKQQRKDEVKLLKKPGKKAQKVAKLGLGGMPTNVAEAIKAQAAASKAIAKGVKKDLKLSDANVDTRLRATRQSKMLEALFEIYFRVLKHCVAFGANLLAQESKKGPQDPSNEPASVPAPGLGWSRERFMRRFPLLYPALEGLARYTHLISVEYFNDLMEGFKDLLRSPALPLEDRFRLLLTASDILRGQGEALTIDRKDFYIKLYEAIGLVPYRQLGVDEEYDDESAPGQGGPSSSDQGSVDLSGQESLSVLLASTLQQMLCDTKISDIARVAAFLKRSASISLICGSSEAVVFLGVIMRLLRRYPRLLTMLEYEGEAPVGGRMFDPMCHDPSEAGAMGASLWELSVLTRSSHPHLAQAAASLLSMKPEGAQAQGMTLTGPLALAGTAKDLALAYDSSRGSFNPAPHAPKAVKLSGSSVRRLQQAAKKDSSHEMTEQMLGGVPKIGSSSKISRSLLTFYTINKRFQVNSELRREKVLLLEKLNRFKRHLIEVKKQ